MENYTGKICPYCMAEIKEGDTVHVCSSCNTPHHEVCWEKNKGCTTPGCPEEHKEETNSVKEPETSEQKITDMPEPEDASTAKEETTEIVIEESSDNTIKTNEGSVPSGNNTPAYQCANCGTPMTDDQIFCPNCGAKRPQETKNICSQCGLELMPDQQFCPRCGQKVGLNVEPSVNEAISQFNANIKKKDKKIPIIICSCLAAVVVFIVIIINSGSGKKIHNSGPDLENLYQTLCDPAWSEIAGDGSYLTIDSNPYDIDDYLERDAWTAVNKINMALNLPESINSRISTTRAIDGRQEEIFEDITVSWTYHPDTGLEIMWEKKSN